MGTNLHSEILRAELEKLVGLPLWGVGLAAGMLTLAFGNRYTVRTSLGREVEKGDFGLHIQCAWRIAREDEVVAGFADYVALDHADRSAFTTFYEALQSLFVESPRVEAVESLRAGAFSLRLEGSLYVEAFPSFSVVDPESEFWRLLSREPDQHFVVGPGGLDVS
jgi:hypothetical protein